MSIATIYRGIEYRSRLEARWAAFFDALGWQHTYEPFDGDGYIPDFLIHGDRRMLVEIKPASALAEFQAPIKKVTEGVRRLWDGDILILGVDPFPRLSTCWGEKQPPGGLIGEASGFEGDEPDWWFAAACWVTCTKCNRSGLFHDMASYAARPCGHHAGDHYMGWADVAGLKGGWARATNDVKWRGRDAA